MAQEKAKTAKPQYDTLGAISGAAQGLAMAVPLFQDAPEQHVGFTGFEDEETVDSTLASIGGGEYASSLTSGLLSGVTAGGAIGGAAGAVIGGIVGLFGGLFGGSKKKRAAARARARARALYLKRRKQAQEKKQLRLQKERLEVQKMLKVGKRKSGIQAKSLLDAQAQNVAEYNKILGLASGSVKSNVKQRVKNAGIRAQAAVSGQYRYANAKVDKLNRLEELLMFETKSVFDVSPGTLKYRDALQSAVQEFEEF